MPSVLETRLAAVSNAEPAGRVMAGSARWPNGFGAAMNEVRSVVVHLTAGWPTRIKAEEFVKHYIGPPVNPVGRDRAGFGTQYFVPGDGTVVRLIDMPSVTWHANHTNLWAIGVETGNLGHTAAPPRLLPKGSKADPTNNWVPLGPSADHNVGDIPGAKLWLSKHRFGEVLVSWYATKDYTGPAREAVGGERWMLFSDAQYRSWALLARFLCERHDLPRNFPLLPHALRSKNIGSATAFRRIALADERFPVLVRALAPYNIKAEHFEAAQAATLQALYVHPDAVRAADNAKFRAKHSRVWGDMFDVYRGFHGHGYSGSHSTTKVPDKDHPGQFKFVPTDHDCAGPMFDWHRFAREVWDWWWYPFDLTDDLSRPVLALRPERSADGSTPLIEYYFEGRDFEAKDLAYALRAAGMPVLSSGIFGDVSSPSTFALEAGVPIYAPANGELVAARFPDTGTGVSMAFLLVRHEIFHLPDTLTIDIDGQGAFPANPGRIDYDREPSHVYSLVMHLGRRTGMSFDTVNDANPDWLNRVLMRKKECDLAVAKYDGDPKHGGVPQAAWDALPPGAVARTSPLESWRADRRALGFFLERLKAGDVAVGGAGRPGETPIRVILGDLLGEAGVTRKEGSAVRHGIGMEVFASGFIPPGFGSHNGAGVGWTVPPAAPGSPPPAVFYQSEWARSPSSAERKRLEAIGVNPDLVNWWPDAALNTALHPTLPASARLNREGYAFHVQPLDFMRWINHLTWASEWPKYQVTDANGAAVPLAPNHLRPRSRRV